MVRVFPLFMGRVGEVRAFEDNRAALHHLTTHDVHILVIANSLLLDGGAPLIHALRHRQPSAQVLVLCEQETTEVPAWVLAEGVGDMLVKPFDVAGLAPRLERLLDVMGQIQSRSAREHTLEARMRHHDRVALLGTFVATLAHDVANPLSVVSTNAALLADLLENHRLLSQQEREFMIAAVHDTQSAARAIKDYTSRILAFSRSESAGQWDTDLAETLRTALLFARARMREKRVRVQVGKLDTLPPVSHHGTALAQAVVNALTNAIDAAGPGGHVALRVEESPDYVTIVVEDNGPGLTPEQHERLCDPFYTTKETGTGLGTVVMQQVMREHGGSVQWLNRADGCGVLVALALPKRPSTLPPPERYVSR